MLLSPGIIVSCFELLEIVGRHQLSFSEIYRSFDKIGVSPVDKSLAYAQEMGWISSDINGVIIVLLLGKRLISIENHEHKLRQAILDYIDIKQPAWVQNAPFGRQKLLLYVGSEIFQTFLEAGLVDGISDDVVTFWDTLSARARGLKDSSLLKIGRLGERLTFEYEAKRTENKPKWMSIETNEDGYDILSILNSKNNAKLLIEVKTSKIPIYARFYITKNEWECAAEALNHCFHLWDVSQELPRLAIIDAADIVPHIAINQGYGEWSVVSIPFAIFNEKFTTVDTETYSYRHTPCKGGVTV